jgi:hypothetical protein
MKVWTAFSRMPDRGHASTGTLKINAEIEQALIPSFLTEAVVAGWWLTALSLEDDSRCHWLLLIRLAEAALLCAANYADSGEYEAAGDLLVNPREVLVHRLQDGFTTIKHRHATLSEQFGLNNGQRAISLKRFCADNCLEISKPPLLPLMQQVLHDSGRVSRFFLRRLADVQRRIADTLAFLAAWQISDSVDLWRQLQAASKAERMFVESQLCRLDTSIFDRIGKDLRCSLADPDYRSLFLARPSLADHKSKQALPAGAPTPAAS